MPRRKDATRQAVRQAQLDVKAARLRAQKLLRAANTDLRGYRKQLATLQKQGVVSARIIAKQHKPTRYMIGKLKKFKAVALGRELAVPAKKLSPHTQRLYKEKGLAEQIGNFFVIPKTAERQRADIHKGHIRVTTQLNRGEEQVIKFPARLEDMNDFLSWAEANQETLNTLKGPRDQFGFQIFGHNSKRGFPNMQELVKHLQNYSSILNNPRYAKEAIQEFVLMRFRPAPRGTPHPEMEPYYGVKKYSKKKKDRKDQRRGEEHRREMERQKKARQRYQESAEDRERRLAKQQTYDRARANERREKRMAKRLMGD